MYTLPIGTKITSPITTYTITGVLGQGGFGITYSATFMLTVGTMKVKANVALKEHFVKADCVRDSDTSRVSCSDPARSRVEMTRKDFVGEARRLNSISGKNTNIVTVNEVFEANNTAYYAMEMIEGESLRDYVASRGTLTERETLAIMTPIVEAVAFLHRNRITHLDIKPQNIMIAADESGNLRPVLIDFGLSKHYDESGDATSTINSRGFSDGYAPIEQYTGITTFSPASDVYSLAATMVFCLTGQRLPAAIKVTAGVLEETLPHSLTPSLRRTLIRALSMQDDKRHADAGELLSALGGDDTSHEEVTADIPPSEVTVVDTPVELNTDDNTIAETPAPQSPAMVNEGKPKTKLKYYTKSGKSRKKSLIIAAICLIAGIFVYEVFFPKVWELFYYDAVSMGDYEGLYPATKNGKHGMINKMGMVVIPLIYDYDLYFSDGLAMIKKGKKMGFVNKTGDRVVPLIYDDIMEFHEGMAGVKKDGKWGFVNMRGDEVIPLIYDNASSFVDGKASVEKYGEWFYIDKSGNRVNR